MDDKIIDKVYIPLTNKSEAETVQQIAIDLGFTWINGHSQILHPEGDYKYCLYLDYPSLSWSDNKGLSNYPEISPEKYVLLGGKNLRSKHD